MIEPSAEYLDSYIEAYDENAVAGITAHRFRDARKEDVLARFDAYAHERDLPPNRVGAHFYWLVDDARGRFLGEISVRHRLTEALRRYAGHIGYGVRASEQGKGYGPLMLRTAAVPVVNIGSNLSWPLFLVGLIVSWEPLVYAGIALFALAVLFALITLPVEFNASKRALAALESGGYLQGEELRGARKVLSAAAMTYVASAFMAIMQLLRLLAIAGSRRRD